MFITDNQRHSICELLLLILIIGVVLFIVFRPYRDKEGYELESEIKSEKSITATNLNITDWPNFTLKFYPIGSIYISTDPKSPTDILGGTWEQITNDVYLKTCASSNEAGQTGGSHTITTDNLPAHKHDFSGNKISGTISDIMIYDGGGMKKEDPTGCFSWTKYGSRTWDGQKGSNAGLKISFSATPSGSISNTGKGNEFHPKYYGVYMWKRTK